MTMRVALVSVPEFETWMGVARPLPTEWTWLDRLCRGFLGQLAGGNRPGVADTAAMPLVWMSLKDTYFDHVFVWDRAHDLAALRQVEAWLQAFGPLQNISPGDIDFYFHEVDIRKIPGKNFSKRSFDLDERGIAEALAMQDMPLELAEGAPQSP